MLEPAVICTCNVLFPKWRQTLWIVQHPVCFFFLTFCFSHVALYSHGLCFLHTLYMGLIDRIADKNFFLAKIWVLLLKKKYIAGGQVFGV